MIAFFSAEHEYQSQFIASCPNVLKIYIKIVKRIKDRYILIAIILGFIEFFKIFYAHNVDSTVVIDTV